MANFLEINMSNGINVANITFDANGEILGLADDVLASISAGAIDLDTSNSAIVENGYKCNSGCGK
jgi:hypothetical protein